MAADIMESDGTRIITGFKAAHGESLAAQCLFVLSLHLRAAAEYMCKGVNFKKKVIRLYIRTRNAATALIF